MLLKHLIERERDVGPVDKWFWENPLAIEKEISHKKGESCWFCTCMINPFRLIYDNVSENPDLIKGHPCGVFHLRFMALAFFTGWPRVFHRKRREGDRVVHHFTHLYRKKWRTHH